MLFEADINTSISILSNVALAPALLSSLPKVFVTSS